jgi:hypothetical protein
MCSIQHFLIILHIVSATVSVRRFLHLQYIVANGGLLYVSNLDRGAGILLMQP